MTHRPEYEYRVVRDERHEHRPGFQNPFSAGWTDGAPWVKRLIAVNIIIWIIMAITMRSETAHEWWFLNIALTPDEVLRGKVWQFITSMFMHAPSPMHVILNMFILYIFGPSVERDRGSGWFLKFYLVCGIAANLVSFGARFAFGHGDVHAAGASGAVLGIVTACLMIYHNQMFYVLWVFPVKALYIYYFLLILEAVWIISPVQDDTDHYAHLGGLIVAWLLLRAKWPPSASGGSLKKPRKPKRPKLATPKRGKGDGPRDFLEV